MRAATRVTANLRRLTLIALPTSRRCRPCMRALAGPRDNHVASRGGRGRKNKHDRARRTSGALFKQASPPWSRIGVSLKCQRTCKTRPVYK